MTAVQRCTRVKDGHWETADIALSDDARTLWVNRFVGSYAAAELGEMGAVLWYQDEERAGRSWNTLDRPRPFVPGSEPTATRTLAAVAELQLQGLIQPVRFRPGAFTRIDGSHVP